MARPFVDFAVQSYFALNRKVKRTRRGDAGTATARRRADEARAVSTEIAPRLVRHGYS